jgi:hypothetical protein
MSGVERHQYFDNNLAQQMTETVQREERCASTVVVSGLSTSSVLDTFDPASVCSAVHAWEKPHVKGFTGEAWCPFEGMGLMPGDPDVVMWACRISNKFLNQLELERRIKKAETLILEGERVRAPAGGAAPPPPPPCLSCLYIQPLPASPMCTGSFLDVSPLLSAATPHARGGASAAGAPRPQADTEGDGDQAQRGAV